MTPEMQQFIAKFAAAIGTPDQLRQALEILTYGLMISPVEFGNVIRNLAAAGKVPDAASALAAMAAFVADAPAPAASATSTTPEADASSPKAPKAQKAEKPKAEKPAPAPAGGVSADSKVTAFSVDGTETAAAGWRGAYIGLAEAAIDAGKIDAIPKTWFRDGPSASGRATEKQIKGGQWLYTNIDKVDQAARCRTLAGILGVPVAVKTADGATITLS
jgi:hypothetical protein